MSNSRYVSIPPISVSFAGFAQPITALSFDPVSDILWAGTNAGSVAAYLGTTGIQGPCFRVGGNLSVKKVTVGHDYVHAASNLNDGMGSWTKGGVNKWFHRPSTKLMAFSNTLPSSTVLATSTLSLELAFISQMTGSVLRKVQTSSLLTHLEFSHSSLLSGSSDGYVRIHDPKTGMGRSGGSENFARAHVRSVQGLQVSGNYIFTIGMGERQSRPFPDPLVKVYDMRTMRSLPPIPFPAGPAFIHTMPKRTSSLVIISSQGLVNVVDASNPSAPVEFCQLDATSYLTSTAISPTAAFLAFGDSDGTIHLISQTNETLPFNGFEGQPVPIADIPAPLPSIVWTDSTPLNTIGMPFFDTQLLSAWHPALKTKRVVYPGPQSIPAQVLSSMKYNDKVAYASLPKELRGRRNMAMTRKGGARFRSDKGPEIEPGLPSSDHYDAEIPQMYQKVEIEYSKFGVEDFDFGFYNKTEFSGLETHILNSYTNSVVQAMHYISPIRRLAKAHISIDCPREHCLLCELGFISRMLEDAGGINCQASNFCKTVGVLAQSANAIEIIDYGRDGSIVDYSRKIQAFHRFLLEALNAEINLYPRNPTIVRTHIDHQNPAPSAITQLLGIEGQKFIKCTDCKSVRERPYLTHALDMFYPLRSNVQQTLSFAELLRHSLFRPDTHKATCQHCKRVTLFTSTRSVASSQLPPLLAINSSIYSDETLGFWRDQQGIFMTPQISLHGQVNGVDDSDEILYDVRAVVLKVTGKDQKSHLVAIIKVPEAEGSPHPWYLFNDFLVRNITQEEALNFHDSWKVPAIIYLERTGLQSTLVFDSLSYGLTRGILSCDASISLNRDPSLVKHQVLHAEEMPKPGTLVAIDAEFVLMQQEETEFRSDGTKKVLRPARLSLARVSALRGSGPRQGVPFIDDHIHTSEIIVDYLTEFSGVKFGDLDPAVSPYTLTPLKLVYKKLRYLVDCGCIFIGHGLSKDFRIINIYVPPEQVIDTVDLYFLKSRQRRLSLRFLSWFILGEHIQNETHDSIEDARSALRLYHAYQAFEEQRMFDQKLEEIYREGRGINFKPPALPAQTVDTHLAVDRSENASPVLTWAYIHSASPNHRQARRS